MEVMFLYTSLLQGQYQTSNNMTWIETIPYLESTGKLKRLFDRVKGPANYIDNILLVHGLRPHTLQGHMALYKNVLHHKDNTLQKWYLETIGVYVSILNQCIYCIEHHYSGLRKLLSDDDRSARIRSACEKNRRNRLFLAI